MRQDARAGDDRIERHVRTDRAVVLMLFMAVVFIVTMVFLVSRADGYATKAKKFDEYCVEVRARVSTSIDDMDKARWRDQALERFSMLADDIERCTPARPTWDILSTCKTRGDIACAKRFMIGVRDGIQKP